MLDKVREEEEDNKSKEQHPSLFVDSTSDPDKSSNLQIWVG